MLDHVRFGLWLGKKEIPIFLDDPRCRQWPQRFSIRLPHRRHGAPTGRGLGLLLGTMRQRSAARKFERSSKWVCLKMSCTPFYPMVSLIIIPFLNGYFIGNISSDKPKWG